jgi:hypothetical protein
MFEGSLPVKSLIFKRFTGFFIGHPIHHGAVLSIVSPLLLGVLFHGGAFSRLRAVLSRFAAVFSRLGGLKLFSRPPSPL